MKEALLIPVNPELGFEVMQYEEIKNNENYGFSKVIGSLVENNEKENPFEVIVCYKNGYQVTPEDQTQAMLYEYGKTLV